MPDLIVIAGSPGSGKTTTAELLREKLASPYIDFGWFREFHLDREWKNQSVQEEQMSFENLVFVIKNYVRHGYKNVIVTDLKDFRVREIPSVFADFDFVIVTLCASNEEIKRRIIKRNDGFRDASQAVDWNQNVQMRQLVKNEYRIDNTNKNPEQTLSETLKTLRELE